MNTMSNLDYLKKWCYIKYITNDFYILGNPLKRKWADIYDEYNSVIKFIQKFMSAVTFIETPECIASGLSFLNKSIGEYTGDLEIHVWRLTNILNSAIQIIICIKQNDNKQYV